MQVIFLEDVDPVALAGDEKDVKIGYARNFLFPRNLAAFPDDPRAAQVRELADVRAKEREARKATNLARAASLEGVSVTIPAKAGDEGKLFGSVTAEQVAEALTAAGHAVEKKEVHVDNPIKTVGAHSVRIALGDGIEQTITVNVEPEA